MSRPRHRRRRAVLRPRILVAGAGTAAAIVAAAAVLLWPRGGDPVTEAEAVEAYAAERGGFGAGDPDAPFGGIRLPSPASKPGGEQGAASPLPASSPDASGATQDAAAAPAAVATVTGHQDPGVPAPGVYAFTAAGSERVQVGPASDTRSMAETVTATVRHAGGCWTFTHDIFAEHSETTRYCPGPGGSLTSPEHSKRQKIGVVTAEASLRCEPGTVLPAEPATARSWDVSCHMATATPLFTATTRQDGTVATLGAETVQVGPDPVPAWHVRIRRQVGGDLSGHWHEDIWFSRADHTIVRIERDAELRGPATFSEQSEYTLRSLQPRS